MSSVSHVRYNADVDQFADVVPQKIDHELSLIREAIGMVRVGAATRVTVGSLRFADELLPRARALAGLAGLRAVPLWTLDEAHHAIAIERRHG